MFNQDRSIYFVENGAETLSGLQIDPSSVPDSFQDNFLYFPREQFLAGSLNVTVSPIGHHLVPKASYDIETAPSYHLLEELAGLSELWDEGKVARVHVQNRAQLVSALVNHNGASRRDPQYSMNVLRGVDYTFERSPSGTVFIPVGSTQRQ